MAKFKSILLCVVVAAAALLPRPTAAQTCNTNALGACAPPSGPAAGYCNRFGAYFTCASAAGCASSPTVAQYIDVAVSLGCSSPVNDAVPQPVVLSNNGSIIFDALAGDIGFQYRSGAYTSAGFLLQETSTALTLAQSHAVAAGAALSAAETSLATTLQQQTSAASSSSSSTLAALSASVTASLAALSAANAANAAGASAAVASLISTTLAQVTSSATTQDNGIDASIAAQLAADSAALPALSIAQAVQATLISAAAVVVAQQSQSIASTLSSATSSSGLVSQLSASIAATTGSLATAAQAGMTAANTIQTSTSTALLNVINCTAAGLVYGGSGFGCTTPINETTIVGTGTCVNAANGNLILNAQANDLQLCANTTSTPLVVAPQPLGSRSNPAGSCGDISANFMPDGYYYVASPYTQVYCRDGSLSYQPPFTAIGLPYVYYPWDADISDHMGHVYTIRIGNSPFAAGRVVNSLVFDGASYTNISIDGNLWTNPWTLSGWFKFNGIDLSHDNPILGHGTNGNQLALHLGERTGGVYFGFYGSDLAGPATLTAGVWWHITWSYDGNSTKTIYMNGIQVAQNTGLDYLGVNTITTIGRYTYDTSFLFAGAMDDMLIFVKTLSPYQVYRLYRSYLSAMPSTYATCADIYNGGFPSDFYSFPNSGVNGNPITVYCAAGVSSYFGPVNYLQPVSYFSFNGNANDAMSSVVLTPSGTLSYVSGRQNAAAAVFDGSSTYFTYPIINPAMFGSAFSVSFWVYFNAVNRVNPAVDNSVLGSGINQNNHGLHITERGGTFYVGYYANDVQTAAILVAGTWYHMTVTTPGNGCRSLYINGQPLVINGGCGQPFLPTNYTTTTVGTYPWGGAAARLDGKLQSLFIFATQLQVNDVALLYSQS